VIADAAGADTRLAVSTHRAQLALVGVITGFVVLATIIAIKTPAYESADEPGHVQNIETLVRGQWYGMNGHLAGLNCELIGKSFQCVGTEAHQAPLYYLLLASWQRVMGVPAQAPPKQATTLPGPHGLFRHHSSAELHFLLWLRLPNVLLGALTVLVTYFAVRLVSSDPWTPVVGASIVAFLPRFVFLSSFVTNDNLVNLLGAILTVVALRYVRRPSGWRMAAVGAVVGLLLATKLSTLPVVLVLVAMALMVMGWRRRVELLGIGILAVFATSGWYLIQNTVRYGDPLARRVSAAYLSVAGGLGTGFAQPYKPGDPLTLVFARVPWHFLNTFWYQSGWNQFQWPWAINLMFWLVLVGALAGLGHRRIERSLLATLCLITLAGVLAVWGAAFQTATYQARLAFVGLAALAVLAAVGLERWKLPVRFILPAMGLCGTLVAIQQNVLAVQWS
jgi:4-amino-4-deoxy-L-arabinose transferase-like glycosyltransferase